MAALIISGIFIAVNSIFGCAIVVRVLNNEYGELT